MPLQLLCCKQLIGASKEHSEQAEKTHNGTRQKNGKRNRDLTTDQSESTDLFPFHVVKSLKISNNDVVVDAAAAAPCQKGNTIFISYRWGFSGP